MLTHPHVHDHSNRSSNIQIQRNTFLHETHTHRIIISHFLLPLTHFTEDWWIQLWSERCRNRAMDNYGVTLACSILFFLIFFLIFFFFERMPISRDHRTNRKASTDSHEQWAVNTTIKLIMMMTVRKMMTTADERKKNKTQTTKLLSSRSLVIGQ